MSVFLSLWRHSFLSPHDRSFRKLRERQPFLTYDILQLTWTRNQALKEPHKWEYISPYPMNCDSRGNKEKNKNDDDHRKDSRKKDDLCTHLGGGK